MRLIKAQHLEIMFLLVNEDNMRPAFDKELVAIADYVVNHNITSDEAYSTARYCLLDALGCAYLAKQYPACTKLLSHSKDLVSVAFDIGILIRWLDFNDTWLAAEWGHPSDNLGAILAIAQDKNLSVGEVLTAMIKAYEIQGILALKNSFNRVGLDHVILVKLASTAVATQLLGGTREQIIDALSQVFVDGQALRTYRHAPNTGPRKSWAAGDATSRAVRLAQLTLMGEKGYPTALTAKTWGFYDVSFQGKKFDIPRPYDSYVIENILFKVSYPAEFHAQTAVEAAIKLYPIAIDKIKKIVITTHESAIRIISKTGPLYNPADRDHCLQYMVAVALIQGDLKAEYYEDSFVKNPKIDLLREKMEVIEEKNYSEDYLDPEKRSITNAVQIYFNDGTETDKVIVEYPLGHMRRRKEAIPLIIEKFQKNATKSLSTDEVQKVIAQFQNLDSLKKLSISQVINL